MKKAVAVCCTLAALAALRGQNWTVAYDGGGAVVFGEHEIRMRPASAVTPEQTHAALALGRSKSLLYFETEFDFINLHSTRVGIANPWETFWLFFNYKPDGKFKRTNYIAFKTNGVEIGIAEGDRDQKILKTWDQPVFPYGETFHVKIRRMGTLIEILINRKNLLRFDFARESVKPLRQRGRIGLYTEDAEVSVKYVKVTDI